MGTYILWWALSGIAGMLIFMLALKIDYGAGISFDPTYKSAYVLFYPLLGGIVFVLSILFLLMILFDELRYYFGRR